jgi:hypothetical protein
MADLQSFRGDGDTQKAPRKAITYADLHGPVSIFSGRFHGEF